MAPRQKGNTLYTNLFVKEMLKFSLFSFWPVLRIDGEKGRNYYFF